MDKQMLNRKISEPDWLIERRSYIPGEDGMYESLFALSNGETGLRATVDFEAGGGSPGCFFHDLYGNGLAVKKELVNALNFFYWHLHVDALPIYFSQVKILKFLHCLDLYRAAVYLEVLFEDALARQTEIRVYYCLPAPHGDLMLTQFEITPVNHHSPVHLFSGVDWRTGNGYLGGTEPGIKVHHLTIDSQGKENNIMKVLAKNRSDDYWAAVIMKHFSKEDNHIPQKSNNGLVEMITINSEEGETYFLVRAASFGIGRDKGELLRRCEMRLSKMGGNMENLQRLLDVHYHTWESRWQGANIHIDGPLRDVQALRFGVLHLLQAPQRGKEKTNIAARGLTAEYHSGHIFFNTEFYMVPYYCLFEPPVARQLILHRIKTLEAARDHARKTGFKGARYPEEADMEGRPAAPFKINDLFSGEESTEWSGVEVMHLSADMIYALDRYLDYTGDPSIIDKDFVDFIVEIAEFCADLLKYDEKVKGYGARQVMCFDESHYHVDHHYATNFLCSWAIKWVDRKLAALADEETGGKNAGFRQYLAEKGVDKKKRKEWLKIAASVYLPPKNNEGVIPQFEGYFSLPDQCIQRRSVNMLPEIETNVQGKLEKLDSFASRLIKQADVVFLMSLFPGEFDRWTVERNFHFYEQRTLHASSLSMTPHASAAARLGLTELAYNYLITALRYNLDFQPRDNYRNGIHLGGYAGAVVGIVKDILGFQGNESTMEISFAPRLPANWKALTLRFYWRGYRFDVQAAENSLTVEKLDDKPETLTVRVFSSGKILDKTRKLVRFAPGEKA